MICQSILYGVQGTGNGHISRARLMATEFDRLGVNVEFLFSGRATKQYFDMGWFANRRYVTGLSFITEQGRISRFKTMTQNKPLVYARELASLKTEHYDLVLTDFEPTVSWAARLRGSPSLALGHQYALNGYAPQPSGDLVARWLLRYFAPADSSVGFHWCRYHETTLPPMIDTGLAPCRTDDVFTLVYLPFENQNETIASLQQLDNERFVIYSPEALNSRQEGNVSINPLSRPGFVHDLQRCSRVICNTGFELIAEALHLGVPVLTKPLSGQFEQLANAMTLEQLQLATVTRYLNAGIIDDFVQTAYPGSRIIYPNVARELARFCVEYAHMRNTSDQQKHHFQDEIRVALQAVATRLWSEVHHKTIHAKTTCINDFKQPIPSEVAAA